MKLLCSGEDPRVACVLKITNNSLPSNQLFPTQDPADALFRHVRKGWMVVGSDLSTKRRRQRYDAEYQLMMIRF